MFPGDNTFFSSLRSIIRKMHQISDRELSVHGISHAEMRIMLFLYNKDGCRQDELSVAMGIDRSNVGRSLKKLENLELVIRKKVTEDARSLRVLLTEKGFKIKQVLEQLKTNIESTVTTGISSRDFTVISKTLETMDNNLTWEKYNAIKNKKLK